MAETTTQTSTSNEPRFNWVRVTQISAVVLLIVGFMALVIAMGTAGKEGVEFSPDNFQTREFSYGRIEWLDMTTSRLQHNDTTTSLQRSLINDNLITATNTSNPTWHLVSDSETANQGDSSDFDARILHNYLRMPFWDDWNLEKKNAVKAKAMWPAVASLARNYAYWAIPDVMDLALHQSSLSDQEFVDQVDEISVQALLQNANMHRENGDMQEAERSLDAAVNFKKTAEVLTVRAKVYDKLGKPRLAAADRKLAAEMAAENGELESSN